MLVKRAPDVFIQSSRRDHIQYGNTSRVIKLWYVAALYELLISDMQHFISY